MSSLTIDIHTHILPEKMPDWASRFGYGGFVQLEHHKPCCAKMMIDGKFFREIEDNCWSAEKRMHECDHHRVHVQHAAAAAKSVGRSMRLPLSGPPAPGLQKCRGG